MRLALALAFALLAAPAAAQDAAAQYRAAARAFSLPGVESLSPGDVIEDDAILAVLPRLAGVWMPVTTLFPYAEGFNPDLFAESCARIAWTLEPTAARSFALRRTRDRDGVPVSLTVRYDWMIANTFDRGVDEDEVIAFMGLDAAGDIPAMQLTAASMRGYATLFHPSPDVLVIVAPGMAADILLRCPT